jgi:hypothetical protein
MQLEKKLDALTYQGWYYKGDFESIIYGGPSAVFASKKILDPLMNNYHQSLQDEEQKKKAKINKESDSSIGF